MAQVCMEDHDFYSQCALRISRESEMKTITYNPETHVLVPRELNPNWCAGCSPDNCSGCGAEPVDGEPAMWVMKHI